MATPVPGTSGNKTVKRLKSEICDHGGLPSKARKVELENSIDYYFCEECGRCYTSQNGYFAHLIAMKVEAVALKEPITVMEYTPDVKIICPQMVWTHTPVGFEPPADKLWVYKHPILPAKHWIWMKFPQITGPHFITLYDESDSSIDFQIKTLLTDPQAYQWKQIGLPQKRLITLDDGRTEVVPGRNLWFRHDRRFFLRTDSDLFQERDIKLLTLKIFKLDNILDQTEYSMVDDLSLTKSFIFRGFPKKDLKFYNQQYDSKRMTSMHGVYPETLLEYSDIFPILPQGITLDLDNQFFNSKFGKDKYAICHGYESYVEREEKKLECKNRHTTFPILYDKMKIEPETLDHKDYSDTESEEN